MHPIKTSWTRAKNLAHNTNTSPKQARTYLSQNPQIAPEFDQPIDKRNPKTRQIIQNYLDTLQPLKINDPTTRPSKGDPTRPPRAGAPQTKPTSPTPQQLAKTLTQQINNADPTQTNTETLHELNTLAQKHGGIPNLTYALAILHHLQN